MDLQPVNMQVQLNDEQAWALAQLLKRLGYSDCRGLAQSNDEAWLMMDAAQCIRDALAQAGCAPR